MSWTSTAEYRFWATKSVLVRMVDFGVKTFCSFKYFDLLPTTFMMDSNSHKYDNKIAIAFGSLAEWDNNRNDPFKAQSFMCVCLRAKINTFHSRLQSSHCLRPTKRKCHNDPLIHWIQWLKIWAHENKNTEICFVLKMCYTYIWSVSLSYHDYHQLINKCFVEWGKVARTSFHECDFDFYQIFSPKV